MKVIFEFAGGSRDGQTDVGEQARNFYFLTENGTVGKRFKGLTDYTMNIVRDVGVEEAAKLGAVPARTEKYEVIERLEVGDEVLVRCKFIGHE